MGNVVRMLTPAVVAGLVWLGSPAVSLAEPGTVPAWYPEGFPYLPAVDPPPDDAAWMSMECATVITLRYERSARSLYRELREAAETAGWTVRPRQDPEYDYRFDASLEGRKVLAMFDANEDGTSRLVLYVLDLPEGS
ncbi:MAG: hypothetical protein JXB32_18505 [Deltaproteobacteria bacterium]|nr:hypothetical protein [Deltaproteobacteria bacterium]